MEKKRETILGWMIFVGMISHYLFGYFFWDKLGSDLIYSITAYFLMDIMGMVIFVLALTRFLKGLGCLGMILGTYYFYMEFRDPMVWNDVDFKGLPTFGLSVLNLFFVWYYTDLFKKLKIKK